MTDTNEQLTVMGLLNQWLARIEGKIDHLARNVEGKADRTEVAELRQELRHESGRIDNLTREVEHRARSEQEDAEERRYKVPVQLTVLLVVLTLVLIVVGVIQLVH